METIILNRMYAGSYLDEGENIGHEVINLFKDDNGSNYIYINHNGKINKKSNDSVKAILLVKYVEPGVLEVVAKAENLQQIYYDENNYKEEINKQIEYIKKHQITYGNVLLSDIYKDGNTELLITFKTDKLRTVKKPIFLIEDETKCYKYEHYYFLSEKHFSSQSLKMYYFEDEFPNDYEMRIQRLDDYIQSTGKKYKDCLATIRNWAKKEGYIKPQKQEKVEYIENTMTVEEYFTKLKEEKNV